MIVLFRNRWYPWVWFSLIIGLLLLHISSYVNAQILNIQTYNNEDGLSQSQVQTIIQDSQGYLWFGTVDGLSRFNGTSFVNFTVKDGMASNEVTACAPIHDGTIWFGHSDGKITIYSPDTQCFSKFQENRSLRNSQIAFIFEDTRHQIWIGTYDNGIYKYHQKILVHFSKKNGLPYNGILSVCQPDSSTLYLGTENGLIQISTQVDSDQIKPKELFTTNKKLQDNIESLLLDSRGHLWIGTISNGLFEYIRSTSNPNQWSFYHYSVYNGLPSKWIESLFEDQDQNILVGTYSGGVVKLTPGRHAGSSKYRFFYIDKNHGLPKNYVNAIYQDLEGNYWFGTDGGGVAQFRDSSFMLFTKKDGLPGDFVWSIAQSKNGLFWIGTDNGLATCNIKSQFSHKLLFRAFTKKDGLTGNCIQNIFVDSTGMLWLATSENGVTRFDPTTYQTWKFTAQNGFPSNWVNCIQSDKNNNLWFGTYSEGAFVYYAKQKKYKFFTKKNGLGGNQINQILKDHSGTLWFATNGGLTRYDGTAFRNFSNPDCLTNSNIISIAVDYSNHIWAGSSGGGVFIFDGVRFKNYNTRNGLSGDFIYSITADRKDFVWIGTSRGVDRFDLRDSTITHFGKREGFLGIECNQGAGYRDKYGTLWFGTINGLVHFNPHMVRPNRRPPTVKIAGVDVFYKNIPFTQNLRLHYHQNHLTFHFEAISFVYPSLLRYQFRLEGFDENWSPLTRQTQAIYPKLPPGHYRFLVRARNGDGVWSMHTATFSFYIVSPFWRTGWFIVLVLLVGLGSTFSAYRIRENRIRTNQEILERKVQERTRELNKEKERLRLALQALAQSEEKLKVVTSVVDAYLWSADVDDAGNIKHTLYTENVSKITGFSADEFLKAGSDLWLENIYPEDKEFVTNAAKKLLSKEPAAGAYRIKRRDGKIRWIYDSAIPKLDKTGRVVQINGVCVDITDLKQAEAALAESEEKFRTLAESTPSAIFIYREKYLYVNPAMEKITGYSAEELLLKNFWEIIHPDFQEEVKQRGIARLSEKNTRMRYEAKILTKSGKERWVDFSGKSIVFNGEKAGIASAIDITDRKKTEQALQEREAQLRTLINAMPDIVCFKDGEGRWIEANEFELALFQIKDVPYRGKKASELAEYSEFFRDVFLHCEKTDEIAWQKRTISRLDEVIPQPDGTIKIFDVIKVPIFYEDGSRKGLVVIGRDITERKRMEEALLEEKEQLTVTLQSITDGVISTSADGRVLLMNRVAEELTGWSFRSAQGKPLPKVLKIMDENTQEICNNLIRQAKTAEEPVEWTEPCMLFSKNGKKHLVSLSAATIRYKQEAISGVIVAFRDVTEKRKMERELLKADKLESLGLLAGGIAHDFNNILMGIMGNISLAKMEIDPEEELFDILTEAENASIRAKELTQQLLTFSKGGAPIRQSIDIEKLIKDTCKFALRGSNVSFEFKTAGNIWAANVDEGQISQVINNLIINAKHAMPGGGRIWVRVENANTEEVSKKPLSPGRFVKIVVEDEGIGIPKEYLSKIFDPYFTTKQQGSGLGLSSVYSIIKRHSGHIEVESELGKGTRFTLFLPAAKDASKISSPKAEKSRLGKGKILLMDDEKIIREVVPRMLLHFGYEVTVTSNGEEAVQVYRDALSSQKTFDLVILDLTIPGGMGGKETLQELRKLNPQVKAIVSSGYSTDAVMADYRSFGFVGLVSKPFNMNELGKTIQKALEKRS